MEKLVVSKKETSTKNLFDNKSHIKNLSKNKNYTHKMQNQSEPNSQQQSVSKVEHKTSSKQQVSFIKVFGNKLKCFFNLKHKKCSNNKKNFENTNYNDQNTNNKFSKNKKNSDPKKDKQKELNLNKHKNSKTKNNANEKFNSSFIKKIKANYKSIIVVAILFVLNILLTILILKNNQYYNYLYKPKVIQSSYAIMCILSIALVLTLANYFLYLICEKGKRFRKKKIIIKQKRIIKKRKITFSVRKCYGSLHLKSNKAPSRYEKWQSKRQSKSILKKINFGIVSQYILKFVAITFICLAFHAKCLGLVVIFCFVNFILSVFKLIKTKFVLSKASCCCMMLCDFCILACFYLIFLLN